MFIRRLLSIVFKEEWFDCCPGDFFLQNGFRECCHPQLQLNWSLNNVDTFRKKEVSLPREKSPAT